MCPSAADHGKSNLTASLHAPSAWVQLGSVRLVATLTSHHPNEEIDMKTRLAGWTATTLATAALAAGIAGAAIASDDDDYPGGLSYGVVGQSGVAGSALPMEEILVRLKDQGYDEVYEIERERGLYEVKARDQDGWRVEIYVDPRTGDILRREHDD
jgi:hypothetical protein